MIYYTYFLQNKIVMNIIINQFYAQLVIVLNILVIQIILLIYKDLTLTFYENNDFGIEKINVYFNEDMVKNTK